MDYKDRKQWNVEKCKSYFAELSVTSLGSTQLNNEYTLYKGVLSNRMGIIKIKKLKFGSHVLPALGST